MHSSDYAYFDNMLSDFVDKSPMPLDARVKEDQVVSRGKVPISDVASRYSVPYDVAEASVFAYTLSRFIGSNDVVFTLCRDDIVVPIRVDCADRSCKEYVQSVKEVVTGAVSTGISFSPQDFRDYDLGEDIVMGSDKVDEKINIAFSSSDDCVSVNHSKRISNETAERFLYVSRKIAEGLVSCDGLGSIGYICKKDLDRMEDMLRNETDLEYQNLSVMFEEAVKKDPDHQFCRYQGRVMTMGDAERVSRACASNLIKAGVKKGDGVAIAVTKSEWYLLAPLSIVRAGGYYVAIDHRSPDELALLMLKETRSKVVLVDAATKDRFSALTKDLGIKVMDVSEAGVCDVTVDLPLDIEPLSPAYIQYTSGTTGLPKGAVVSHLNIINAIITNRDRYGYDSDDVFAIASSPSFLAFHMTFWGNILGRLCMVIVPDDLSYDIASLNKFYTENGITITFLITPLAKLYVSNVKSTPLTSIVTGGDAMGYFDYDLDVQLRESYGCTEYGTITFSLVHERYDISCVGKLCYNTKVYILDEERRRVPFGAVGTLYISGPQLTDGYLCREELNAQMFFKNPFCEKPGFEKMFCLGDTARFLPDGTLGILGRKDGQVKIRGFRVEVTEVETAIRRCKDVIDVCVTAPKLIGNERSLVAYIVGRKQFTQDEIAAVVSESKAEYMIPSYVINMPRLPIGRTGKIDRKALPLPEVKGSGGESDAGPETLLCRYMSAVLDVPDFGVNDDFIKMGGDSLKAASVTMASTTDPLWPKDKHLKSSDIMKYRTPRAIVANCVGNMKLETKFTFESGCVMPDGMLNFYASASQEESYLIRLAVSMDDWKDRGKLKKAIESTLDAHPVLRSRAVIRDGIPWVVFDSEIQITCCDNDVFEEGLVVPEPMNVVSGAMCRFKICSSGDGYGVLIDISHIIMDGFSINYLIQSLKDAYDGKELPKDTGVLDASTFSVAIRQTPQFDRSKKMLLGEIEGRDWTPLIKPVHPEAKIELGMHNNLFLDLSIDKDAVKRKADEFGVSVGMLYSAAFGIAEAKCAGKQTSFFAQVQNGRGNIDLEGTICNYANPIPFYTDLSKDMDIAEYVKGRAEHVYELISNDQFPMWDLIRTSKGWYTNILFQYFPIFDIVGDAFPGCDIMAYTHIPLSHLVNIEIIARGDGIMAASIFKPEYDRGDVEKLLRTFESVVNDMCTKKRLSEL